MSAAPDFFARATQVSDAMNVALKRIEASQARLTEQRIERIASTYRREVDLERALPRVSIDELLDDSEAGTRAIVERLEQALRRAQNGIRSNHWASAGPGVAIMIHGALRAERRRLEAMQREAA